MWQIDEDALVSISIGAGILGTGGGGNPYIGMLRARELVRAHGPVDVLDLDELPDDSRVICVGGMGAPTVGVEKVRATESYRAVRASWDRRDVITSGVVLLLILMAYLYFNG
ncbi:MAG: DUF917 family protein [Gemmatimonadota bacterium]|nr:MAG: DUF917 family protein [Gemmatimonadota bacterium]